MKEQNYEVRSRRIREAFDALPAERRSSSSHSLNLSWSNWGFGMEDLDASAARLERSGIGFIELHGNHYGPDLGYRPAETRGVLSDHGIRVAGICGMFGPDNDLSSNRATVRQAAIDYIRRELDFAAEVGAAYMLVVPGAVGRPAAYDDSEFLRSVETLRLVADEFASHNVRAAIEPIRSAEVSFVHTFEDAKRYIAHVDHPAVGHINGDVYHMQSEEAHIGDAIVSAGDALCNLHLADSNRSALGEGSLDLDTIIRALYVIGYNRDGCFCTPEPLGPGGDPYPAMYGQPDAEFLERLVSQTARYFRERESELIGA